MMEKKAKKDKAATDAPVAMQIGKIAEQRLAKGTKLIQQSKDEYYNKNNRSRKRELANTNRRHRKRKRERERERESEIGCRKQTEREERPPTQR